MKESYWDNVPNSFFVLILMPAFSSKPMRDGHNVAYLG